MSWGQNHSPLRTPDLGQSLWFFFCSCHWSWWKIYVCCPWERPTLWICLLSDGGVWFVPLSHVFCKLDVNHETLLGLSSPFGKGTLKPRERGVLLWHPIRRHSVPDYPVVVPRLLRGWQSGSSAVKLSINTASNVSFSGSSIDGLWVNHFLVRGHNVVIFFCHFFYIYRQACHKEKLYHS